MLRSLYIKNYALIRQETIDFKDGLNIIMGETGAGKSMIISALELVLGGRGNSSMVRNGEKKAVIEAHFKFEESHPVFKILDENDLDYEDGEVIARREFSTKGGGRAFLCDSPVNVSILKDFGELVADFYGQHEHHSLLDSSKHIDYLDKFADTEALVNEYRQEFQILKKMITDYRNLINNQKQLKEKIEYDRLRLEEINKVNPKPDESRQLDAELNILQNIERINYLTGQLDNDLYSAEDSVYIKIHNSIEAINELNRYNEEFTQFSEELSTALVSAKEVAAFAKEYSRSIEFNPNVIEEKRQRMSQLRALEKKYGSIRQILKLKAKLEKDINLIDNFDLEKSYLQKKIENQKKVTGEKAVKLSKFRQAKGNEMSKLIIEKLTFLGIEHPAFLVDFQKEEAKNTGVSVIINGEEFAANEKGIDLVTLLISTNLGQSPQPIQQVASGGEISRIMLSIKSLLAHNSDMPLLVFDEIDTGISGRIGRKTGIAMSRLAKYHQIIAITHLAQIAALGDNNIVVEKYETDGETFSQAINLTLEEKIEEVAKLLGDGKITDATRKNAMELLTE